jgi:GT2 family glycosyltransferase
MQPADVHAVVLGYGAGGEHVPLMHALGEAGLRPEHVTLVHNPSTAGGVPDVPSDGRLIRMATNVGYGAGMNAGLRAALNDGAAVVLLLTHDARLPPGTLEAMLRVAERAPRVGILGPALLARGERRPWSYGGVGPPWKWPVHRVEPPRSDAAGVADCDWVDGSVLLVRRALLEETGLFDERFFMYFEEPDLCLRARRAGWRVGVAVEAVAEQSPGAHRRRGAYVYLDTRNGLEFARRLGGRGCMLRRVRAHLAHSWKFTKWYLKDFRDPAVRDEVRREVAPTLAGVAHFARRRWGPPPRWLPGLGDVET